MAKYELTEEFQGGSLQGYINSAPALLVKIFGKPGESDGYKVSGEYKFKKESDGRIFYIYDWKMTTLYDDYEDIPTPEEFWASNEPYRFHVGANGSEGVNEFIEDFNALIEHQTNSYSPFICNDKAIFKEL